MSPRGPFLFRTDSVSNLLQAWARLGPLSLFRAFRPVTDRRLIATVPPRSLTQWGGMAVSRLDGRGFRFPEPVPRISQFHSPLPLGNDFWVVLGSTHHQPIDSLDAARCITCGDVNPDCFMGLFFSPLVSGGLGYRNPLSQTVSPVPFSTVAGRRLPLCPLLLASHSFTVAGSRTPYHEAFSTFAVHFRARRRGEIYRAHLKTPNYLRKCPFSYPPPRANSCSLTR